MWQQEGISDPDKIYEATQEYREEMDAFSHFFDECCIVRENARVSNKMLRAKYEEWCKENGEWSLHQRPFSQKLLERGFEKRRGSASGGYEWYGFGLRGEATRL